jgi:hypothetical protein
MNKDRMKKLVQSIFAIVILYIVFVTVLVPWYKGLPKDEYRCVKYPDYKIEKMEGFYSKEYRKIHDANNNY